MLVLDERETREALPFPELIRAVETLFAGECVVPLRHHHAMEVPGETAATMLLMPAWQPGGFAGVKILNLFPDNHRRALPTIIGRYLLSSGRTGEMLALIEGGELTARRTAATSALASRFLSNPDARRMVMVGTGRLSLNLIAAHAVVRPLQHVSIWGRDRSKAEATAEEARRAGFNAVAAPDLEAACRAADIISCATLSHEPLVRGAWLKPGAHLDLVGAFTPKMRESDDEAVRRASIFVDTREGALHEGGDLVQPLENGVMTMDDVQADLFDLTGGRHPGRSGPAEITLFKSVGAALEDLAGAILAYETARGARTRA